MDAVFDGAAAAGLTLAAEPVGHVAHRARDAARIDLWPLVEPDAAAPPPDWWEPVDVTPPGNARARLAGLLAAETPDPGGQAAPARGPDAGCAPAISSCW